MRGRLACTVLSIVSMLPVTARAQVTPPPPMPAVVDEPLPDWHPPAAKERVVPLFMTMSPEMQQAQRARQAGMWVSALGWLQFLVAGILVARAADVATEIGRPHIVTDNNGNGVVVPGEDARLMAEHDTLQRTSLSLAIVGGALALGGFVVFTAAQTRISKFHKRHPREPLPPLSGF